MELLVFIGLVIPVSRLLGYSYPIQESVDVEMVQMHNICNT